MYFFLQKLFFRIRLNIRKIKAYSLLGKWQIYLYDNVTIAFKPKKTSIGKNFTVLPNAVLELHSQSEITIGNYCTFSYGVVLCIIGKLQIGDYVMVGEYTSIRDTTHEYSDTSQPMKDALDKTESVTIGNNVWIGRGCLIQPGTVIEDGVVVAANSTVKGRLEANSIYGGSPAKFIKKR